MAGGGTVTVLHAECVGPEAAAGTTERLVRDALVASQGDAELATVGGGVTAVFRSALDAIRCARSLQQLVGPNPGLRVRVGIHAGETATEEKIFDSASADLSRRLCASGKPGQVLVSRLVRDLVGSRGGIEAVPIASPASPDLDGWELRWQRLSEPAPPVPPLLAAVDGPGFFGRDAELAQLARAWAAAQEGESSLVMLAGEPGIGKTRLCAELARVAFEDGAVVLFGRCDDEKVVPYQPFVEALSHYAASRAEDQLLAELGALAPDLARLVPELARRLDVETQRSSEPDAERYRLYDAVGSWLRAIAARAPVVLIVDDLHWADKPTLRLLQHVLRSVESAPVLTVGAYRDAEVDRHHPLTDALADLHRGRRFTRIALTGLDGDSVGLLLQAAAGRPLDDVGRALADTIRRDTAGNPLFVREILRHLDEIGAVTGEGSGWPGDLDVAALGLPDLVTDVIAQRLARLPAAVSALLVHASVVGPEFSLDLLEQLVDDHPDEVLAQLEAAVEARLITEVPGQVGQFAFSHALVRQTLYLDLSGPRRARLHAQVAQALERLAADDVEAYLPQLAHHFAQAGPLGDSRRAREYARRAGERAMAQFAYEEAAEFFDQALTQLGPADDGAGRGALLLALGDAQFRAGETAKAKATMTRAAAVARKLGRRDWLARAALDFAGVAIGGVSDPDALQLLTEALAQLGPADSELRARVSARLAMELYASSPADSVRLGDDAVETARRVGAPAALASVLGSRHWAVSDPADAATQLARAEEIVTLAETADNRELQFQGHHYCVVDRLTLGDLDGCEREIATATALAEVLRQPQYLWQAAQYRVLRALRRAELDVAEQLAADALEVGQRGQAENAGLAYGVALFVLRLEQGRAGEILDAAKDFAAQYPALPAWRAAVAWLHAELGQLDEAGAALADVGVLTPDSNWLIATLLTADVTAAVGDTARAHELYEQLLPAAELVVVIGAATACFGAVARTLGGLASTLGRPDDAARHYDVATSITRRLAAPSWLARTEADRGRFLHGT